MDKVSLEHIQNNNNGEVSRKEIQTQNNQHTDKLKLDLIFEWVNWNWSKHMVTNCKLTLLLLLLFFCVQSHFAVGWFYNGFLFLAFSLWSIIQLKFVFDDHLQCKIEMNQRLWIFIDFLSYNNSSWNIDSGKIERERNRET